MIIYLLQSLAWRKKNRIDHIFEEFHRNEMVWKYMPLGVVARENSGNPSNFFYIGCLFTFKLNY